MTQKQYRITPNMLGFTNLFDRLERVHSAPQYNQGDYPPYNVIQTDENNYVVEIAVAGFEQDELSVTQQNGDLIIEGNVAVTETEPKFLHKGISSRKFKRQFTLEDHVSVHGASVVNGILAVTLEREVPEAMKPKQIAIDFKG